MSKKTVAIVFGGRSSEHEISCVTAGGIMAAINRDRFDVIPIGITKSGEYVLEVDDPTHFALRADELPTVQANGTRVEWPDSAENTEIFVTDANGRRSLGTVDVVLPVLHGAFGEDGTFQGQLEMTSMPYVGNGVLASSLAMDKHFAKIVFQAAGIEVAPWVRVEKEAWQRDASRLRDDIEKLGLPIFVKPSRAGSSVGVSRVNDSAELDAALEKAFENDSRVLVEAAVVGREVECAVLQGMPGEKTRVSVAGEISMSDDDQFYDFESKYLNGPGVELLCPAPLTSGELDEMQELAVRAFEAVDGAGLARTDFFLTDHGFVLNEINTLPGFTPISMYPRCWQETGLGYTALISHLLDVALARRGR